MKKYLGIALALALAFMFLFGLFLLPSNKPKEPIYCKYSDEITNEFIREVSKKYHMKCYGTGGRFLTNVKQISLSFDSYSRNFHVEEVRELFVICTEELKNKINDNEKIRPYLDQYPMSESGARVSIAFLNDHGKRVEEDFVAYVFLGEDGNIHYEKYNKEGGRLEAYYKETYEEARRLVEGND